MTVFLPGPPICGFYGMFEADYGDPLQAQPYPRVTPATLAGVVLPFQCPRCRKALWQFSSEESREDYHDTRGGRDNSWCPVCGFKFILRSSGAPLSMAAARRAATTGAAPAKVEYLNNEDGVLVVCRTDMIGLYEITDGDYLLGTAILGSC